MSKLKYIDYEILILIATGFQNKDGKFIEVPAYLSSKIGSTLDADEVAKYFKSEYIKHSAQNPEFVDNLKNAVKLFLKTTSIISISIKQEVALKRGFKLFKDSLPTEVKRSVNKKNEISYSRSLPKLVWIGKQKQFAELIEELQGKEWVEKISDGDLKPIIDNLVMCFDFSKTRVKKTSDPARSLYQILKPSEKEDKIATKRYKPMFSQILQNNQKVVTK